MSDEKLGVLLELGFEERLARGTLAFVDGDVETAIMLLLEGNGVMANDEPRPPDPPPLAQELERTTLIKPYGSYVTSRCGYCQQTQSASMYAFTAFRMRAEDYEQLLPEFCLSGTWCYHPLGEVSCCPLYAIRLPVKGWQPGPEQRASLEKMDTFLARPPEVSKKAKRQKKCQDPMVEALSEHSTEVLRGLVPELDVNIKVPIRVPKPDEKRRCFAIPLAPIRHWGAQDEAFVMALKPVLGALHQEGDYVLLDAHEKPVIAPSPAEELPRRLVVELEEMEYSEEKFELWSAYQTAVHHSESSTEESFRRSYCSTPVLRERGVYNERFGVGGAHMTYRLDGKLVGCGVLLFLKETLASVYFFWDQSMRSCALGHYSVLKEIELAQSLPNIKYYNLLWHCATSKKMAYKMKLPGMEICCPSTLIWLPFSEHVAAKIEHIKYGRLVDDDTIADRPRASHEALYDFRIQLQNGLILPYYDARRYFAEERLDQLVLNLATYLPQHLRQQIVLTFSNPQ